jgi:hypothetical protein
MLVERFTDKQPIALLLEASLYAPFEFENSENWNVLDFLYFSATYDSFCTECKRSSTFELLPQTRPSEHKRNMAGETLVVRMTGNLPPVTFAPPGVHKIVARCTRQKDHFQYYLFFIKQYSNIQEKRLYSTIEKIGQYPSYGDVHIERVKKYTSVLSKTKRAEFVRALGLASHDVGIGAYVYLRRIFEGLLEDAHVEAQKTRGWDENSYARARVNERVALLKHQLPKFLTEHPQIYGLLSKGIHELSDNDCLKHFDTLRICIEIILEERLAAQETEIKVVEARSALSKITPTQSSNNF